MERFCVTIEKFYVTTWLARLGRFSITTKYIWVAIVLAKARRNYVAIELAKEEKFCRDR